MSSLVFPGVCMPNQKHIPRKLQNVPYNTPSFFKITRKPYKIIDNLTFPIGKSPIINSKFKMGKMKRYNYVQLSTARQGEIL